MIIRGDKNTGKKIFFFVDFFCICIHFKIFIFGLSKGEIGNFPPKNTNFGVKLPNSYTLLWFFLAENCLNFFLYPTLIIFFLRFFFLKFFFVVSFSFYIFHAYFLPNFGGEIFFRGKLFFLQTFYFSFFIF